jgi:hypothetical protein
MGFFEYDAPMLRRLVRFLGRMLPALLVAAAWMAWWLIPERPLRQCPLNAEGSWGPIIRPDSGEWAIIVPNDAGFPDKYDFVLRFDPVTAEVTKMPTPHRCNCAVAADASRWAWADAEGRLHVESLPGSQPLWTVPADPQNGLQFFVFSPKRWLLILDLKNEQVDVWDVAAGTKLSKLKEGSGEFSGWDFVAPDNLRVIRRDKDQTFFRITMFQLPNGSFAKTIEVPCATGECSICRTEGPYVRVYGGSAKVGETIWDTSASPPRRLPEHPPPGVIDVSLDQQYRMRAKWNWRHEWTLENATTGEVVSRSSDHGRPIDLSAPFTPAFSPDSRFLLLSCQRGGTALPAWTPAWLTPWLHSRGYGVNFEFVVLCDPATGRERRVLPGIDLVQIAPHGDRIWLIRSGLDGSMVLEEWPISPPPLPWWLWAITAAGPIWHFRKTQHRQFRNALIVRTPA